MDNQNNNQQPIDNNPINQTPIDQPPISPEIPTPEPIVQTPIFDKTPIIEAEPQPQPEIQPQPETPSSSGQYQQILNEYATKTEVPPVTEKITRSNEEQLQNLGITVPSKTGGGFLKVFFIIALLIFIFVLSALVFVYLKNQSDNSDSSDVDTIQVSPTEIPGTCLLNDKTYKVGESFAAADGCNICTCESPDIISCTEKACLSTTPATESATVTPTKIATPSISKISPTATPSANQN